MHWETAGRRWAPLCDNRLQSTTILGGSWDSGHSELLTEPTVFACERCPNDFFTPEPPTDVWQDIRKRGRLKQDAQTFENDGILGAPKVAKRLPVLISHNMYMIRLIGENIELVGMQKILSRVDLDTVPICLCQCRQLCVKMRVVPESQTLLLVIETAKVPQNLLNTWVVTEHHWHRSQILEVIS